MKHIMQRRNNEIWWELNHQPCDRSCKNDAANHSATLPTIDFNNNSVLRQTCGKPLRCGGDEIHMCKLPCHAGDCPPCLDGVSTAKCRLVHVCDRL